jgi:hypothetical protein
MGSPLSSLDSLAGRGPTPGDLRSRRRSVAIECSVADGERPRTGCETAYARPARLSVNALAPKDPPRRRRAHGRTDNRARNRRSSERRPPCRTSSTVRLTGANSCTPDWAGAVRNRVEAGFLLAVSSDQFRRTPPGRGSHHRALTNRARKTTVKYGLENLNSIHAPDGVGLSQSQTLIARRGIPNTRAVTT